MNENLELRTISSDCPICKSRFTFKIHQSLITNASNFPISILVAHDNQKLVVYLDANAKVRGCEIIQGVSLTSEKTFIPQYSASNKKIKAKKIEENGKHPYLRQD